MRPSHWIKNAFVAAPLLFSGQFVYLRAWGACLSAVAAFCLLSSGVYLINDICDRNQDRLHPVKRNRPVASGRVSVAAAVVFAAILLAAGLGISVAVELVRYDPHQSLHGFGLTAWTLAYLALNLMYSLWLKRHAIIDVVAVAMGFVFRAMAGADAIGVPISPWMVLCAFTLCLFIALTKRRGEIVALSADKAGVTRAANRDYTLGDIDTMLTISAAMAILTYSLYCVAYRTVSRIGSAHLIWTIPLVLYGVFRYNRITRNAVGGDPVSAVLRDRVMWIVIVLYVAMTALVLLYGGHASVRNILDYEVFPR
jgi:4-hydroxybenzoate polyprenyltransferase